MTEKEYNICIGKILVGKPLDDETSAQAFVGVLSQMESMLDDGDADDCFGTQGWRYMVGWE